MAALRSPAVWVGTAGGLGAGAMLQGPHQPWPAWVVAVAFAYLALRAVLTWHRAIHADKLAYLEQRDSRHVEEWAQLCAAETELARIAKDRALDQSREENRSIELETTYELRKIFAISQSVWNQNVSLATAQAIADGRQPPNLIARHDAAPTPPFNYLQ